MGEMILLLTFIQGKTLTELDKLNKKSFTKDDILDAMSATLSDLITTITNKNLEKPEEKSAETLINEGLDKLNSNKK